MVRLPPRPSVLFVGLGAERSPPAARAGHAAARDGHRARSRHRPPRPALVRARGDCATGVPVRGGRRGGGHAPARAPALRLRHGGLHLRRDGRALDSLALSLAPLVNRRGTLVVNRHRRPHAEADRERARPLLRRDPPPPRAPGGRQHPGLRRLTEALMAVLPKPEETVNLGMLRGHDTLSYSTASPLVDEALWPVRASATDASVGPRPPHARARSRIERSRSASSGASLEGDQRGELAPDQALVEPAPLPGDNACDVEPVLHPGCKRLEHDQILGAARRDYRAAAELLELRGTAHRVLLEGHGPQRNIHRHARVRPDQDDAIAEGEVPSVGPAASELREEGINEGLPRDRSL